MVSQEPTITPSPTKLQGLQLEIVDHAGYGDTPASYPTNILWKFPSFFPYDDIDHMSKWCEEDFTFQNGGTAGRKSITYGCAWDPKVGYWVKGARTYLVKATNPNPFPITIRKDKRGPEDFLSKWLIGNFEQRQYLRWRNTESCSIVNEKGKPVEDVGIEYSNWIFRVINYDFSLRAKFGINPILGPGESNYFLIKIKANPQNTRNQLDFTLSESVYFNESCTFHQSKYWDSKKDAWVADIDNNHTAIERVDKLGRQYSLWDGEAWLSYVEGTTGAPSGWVHLKDLPEEISYKNWNVKVKLVRLRFA